MSIAERPSSTKPSFSIPPPSKNVLLAAVVFAMLLLHILAGTLVQRALPGTPDTQSEEAITSYGD